MNRRLGNNRGVVAPLIVDSDHYVAYVEDEASPMKGRIAYRLPPAGPGGVLSNL